MPIRIRHSNKSVTELPDDAIFVELTNNAGEIICVLSQNKKDGVISLFDNEALDKVERYKKYFNVEFVDKVGFIQSNQKYL